MHQLTLLGIAALVLTGCPGPGQGGSALIGTWDELATPANNDAPGTATFRSDGTFEIIDSNPETGTYEETDGFLVTTTDAGDVEELPYAIDGNRFTPVGLRHVGTGVGFVGDWRADGTENGEPTTMHLALAADQTFVLDIGDTDMVTGTWRDDNGQLITTIDTSDPGGGGQPALVDLPWFSIDGALSVIAYQRR